MKVRLPTSSIRLPTERPVCRRPFRLGDRTSNVGSHRRIWSRAPLSAACYWLAAIPGLAQVTNLPPLHSDLPSADFSLLRVLGALALVVALFLLGVWAFKHWQRLAVYRGRNPKLNIVEVKPLGNRTALYVVAYEQERLLLASSPSGTQLLTRLPAAAAGEEPQPLPSFAQSFKQALAPAQSSSG